MTQKNMENIQRHRISNFKEFTPAIFGNLTSKIVFWKFDKCSDKILKFFERKCTLNIGSSKRAKRGNYEQINIEEPGDMRVIESFFLKNVKKCQKMPKNAK